MPRSYSLAKRDGGKVSLEIKTENVQLNGETVKKCKDAMKRKSDAISQSPAPPKDVVVEADVKKKSKKKKKTSLETEDGQQSDNRRTLENGLIIEDLSAGNLDAMIAFNASKVYINYIAMLHDGKIVESNVGEKPYKIKLGAGKGKPGCDDGICGMRVGQRSLSVPQSMLNGHKAAEKIPKNQSAIYEVELVKVRKTKDAFQASCGCPMRRLQYNHMDGRFCSLFCTTLEDIIYSQISGLRMLHHEIFSTNFQLVSSTVDFV